jgi:hypothetical protein
VALRETSLKLLNEVILYRAGGGGMLWDRGESQCKSVGSHLELRPKKQKYWDLSLSALYRVHQVLDGHPLARDMKWTALLCCPAKAFLLASALLSKVRLFTGVHTDSLPGLPRILSPVTSCALA